MFKLNQEVVVDGAGAPGTALFGKIAGSPTLLADGTGLAWPVLLDKGMWVEGRKVFIRVLLAHQDGIKAI
jgi:hypothetical protein